MKQFLIITLLTLSSIAWADSSTWVSASGTGWGSSEYWACNDAERDANRQLESSCRWEANGNSYSLRSPHYTMCNCFESGNNFFRCHTNGDAECYIYE